MMLTVPIEPLPNQTLQCQLGDQPCVLSIRQLAYGLFMDVYVGPTQIVSGVACENANRIVRSSYLGLVGDFVFFDTEGDSDPVYTGLGSRFVLVYLEESDLEA